LPPTTSPRRPSATAGTSGMASISCTARRGNCDCGLLRAVLGPSEATRAMLNRCSVCAVHLQRASQRAQHTLRDSPEVPPFHSRVIGRAHAGELRDLLPAQPADPSFAAEDRHAGLFRRQPSPHLGEKPLYVGIEVHALDGNPQGHPPRVPASTPQRHR
jgi:hypothetical protein